MGDFTGATLKTFAVLLPAGCCGPTSFKFLSLCAEEKEGTGKSPDL